MLASKLGVRQSGSSLWTTITTTWRHAFGTAHRDAAHIIKGKTKTTSYFSMFHELLAASTSSTRSAKRIMVLSLQHGLVTSQMAKWDSTNWSNHNVNSWHFGAETESFYGHFQTVDLQSAIWDSHVSFRMDLYNIVKLWRFSPNLPHFDFFAYFRSFQLEIKSLSPPIRCHM